MIAARIREDEISAEVMSAGKVVGVAYLTKDRWDDTHIWDNDWTDEKLTNWLYSQDMNEYADDYIPMEPLMEIIIEAICAEAYDDSGISAQEWAERAQKETKIYTFCSLNVAINPNPNPYMKLWAVTYHPDKHFVATANGCNVKFAAQIFDRSKIDALESVVFSHLSGYDIVARVRGWRPGEVHRDDILEVVTGAMNCRVWHLSYSWVG